ncbi:MAG: hypothetical protein IJQ21_10280 [Lachnospiraceae bacterium]|nr:hypothetical protein [Lachnospiraceae bacterium]
MIFVSIVLIVLSFILFGGLKVLRPQEGLVLTLFGNYYGTLKGEGLLLDILFQFLHIQNTSYFTLSSLYGTPPHCDQYPLLLWHGNKR